MKRDEEFFGNYNDSTMGQNGVMKRDQEFFGNYNDSTMGQNGVRFFSPETALNETEIFVAIVFTEETVISCEYAPKNDADETDTILTDVTFPKGFTLIGRWINVEIESGFAIAYK